MTNVPLIRRVADWAFWNPEQHNQNLWLSEATDPDTPRTVEELAADCGTGEACAAGRVILLTAPAGTTVSPEGDFLNVDDESLSVEEYSNQQLGIEESVGVAIYYVNNATTIARLDYLAEHPDATSQEIATAVPEISDDE